MSEYVDLNDLSPRERIRVVLQNLDHDYSKLMDYDDPEGDSYKLYRYVVSTIKWLRTNFDIDQLLVILKEENLINYQDLVDLIDSDPEFLT